MTVEHPTTGAVNLSGFEPNLFGPASGSTRGAHPFLTRPGVLRLQMKSATHRIPRRSFPFSATLALVCNRSLSNNTLMLWPVPPVAPREWGFARATTDLPQKMKLHTCRVANERESAKGPPSSTERLANTARRGCGVLERTKGPPRSLFQPVSFTFPLTPFLFPSQSQRDDDERDMGSDPRPGPPRGT